MATRAKKSSFELTLTDLEKVVEKLETGELPLEESLELFENGVKLYKECKGQLEKAEKRITKLNELLKERELDD